LEYRMTFHKDAVIDLVCYRRLGHNEADEPAATQPLMYQKIRNQQTPRHIYAEKLVAAGVLTMADADAMADEYRRVRVEQLRELATKLTTPPSNVTLHRQVARIVQDREKMAAGQLPLDWGFAE